MTDRDYAQDFTHLLHVLVDKVRWFTEESVRRAHEVIDGERRTTVEPTDTEPTDTEPAKPAKRPPAKRTPKPGA